MTGSGSYSKVLTVFNISPINNWADLKLKVNNISNIYEIKTGFYAFNY